MKIAITGGSGFIGTNYIDYLLDHGGIELINIDKVPPRKAEHRDYWMECNILEREKLRDLLSSFNPDYVVHLAADLGTDLVEIEDFKANYDGVESLIDACKGADHLKRVIFTSSLLVCHVGYKPTHDTDYKPTTAYGESKVMGEKIVRGAGELPFEWVIIRPISIWGPWNDEPYISFFKAVSGGWYFHIGDGHYRRSLGYVGNTVRQIHTLITAKSEDAAGKTFYVADPEPADLHDMAEVIRELSGARKIRRLPMPLARFAAGVGDLLQKLGWRFVPLTSFRLINIITEYIFDLSPVMSLADWTPTSLREGVQRTLDYMQQNKS